MRSLLKNSIFLGLMVVISVVTLIVQGCDKKNQQPTPTLVVKPIPEVHKQQVKPVQKPASSALKLTPAPVNLFDFSTKKDPFKPFVTIKAGQPSAARGLIKDEKGALPIHSFDVSQFKLIGIVTGGKVNRAMVTDPNGKGYVLNVGMAIGKNEGRVVSITSSGVEILEQFRDDNGKVHNENIKITLPRKQ